MRGASGRRPATSSSFSAHAGTWPTYARELEARGLPYELVGRRRVQRLRGAADAAVPARGDLRPRRPRSLRRRRCAARSSASTTRRCTVTSRPAGASRSAPPCPPTADPRIARACALLREGEALAASLPPGAAIARLCGAARLDRVRRRARELGDSRAGNLLKAIAAARTFSARGLDFAAVVAELDRLTTEGYIEEMSARAGPPRRGPPADRPRRQGTRGARRLPRRPAPRARPGRSGSRSTAAAATRAGPLAGRSARPRVSASSRSREPAGWEGLERGRETLRRGREAPASLRRGDARAGDAGRQRLEAGQRRNAQGPWSALAPYLTEDLPEPGPSPAARRARRRFAPSGRELAAFRDDAVRRRRRVAAPDATPSCR